MKIKDILFNEIMEYRKNHGGHFPQSIKISYEEEYELNDISFGGPYDHIKKEFMGIKLIITESPFPRITEK